MSDESTVAAAPAPVPTPAEAAAQPNETPIVNTATQPQAAKPTPPAQAPSTKKKIKYKVDGQEYEDELDLNDEDYLREQLQMANVARKRMQEYSTLEKEVVEFIKQFKENPKSVLSDPRFGIDVKNLAAQIIEEEIENSKKSPEQLELERTRAEIKALKDQQEREKAQILERERERMTLEQQERYDIEVTQALETSDLPKTPYTVKKLADYMLVALDNGKDIPPKELIPLIREEILSDIKSMFDSMPEDVVEGIVGKQKLDNIRKKNITKAKQKIGTATKAADVGKKSEKKTDEPKMNFKQFFGV